MELAYSCGADGPEMGGSTRGGTDARVMGGEEVTVGMGWSMFVGCSGVTSWGVATAMARVVVAPAGGRNGDFVFPGEGRRVDRVEGGPGGTPMGVVTTTV